jgi:hypothetical protein
MKSCFASTSHVYKPLDPKRHWSRFENALGSNYLPLVIACFEWRATQNIHLLNETSVKDAVEHESFQRICDIHQEMTKGGRENCVPQFLLEMVDGQYPMEFLVAYVYLENSIPKEYEGYQLPFLGRASKLPALLASLGAIYRPPAP